MVLFFLPVQEVLEPPETCQASLQSCTRAASFQLRKARIERRRDCPRHHQAGAAAWEACPLVQRPSPLLGDPCTASPWRLVNSTASGAPRLEFLGWSLGCASQMSSRVLLLLLVPFCPHEPTTGTHRNNAVNPGYLKYALRQSGISASWKLLEILSWVPCQAY